MTPYVLYTTLVNSLQYEYTRKHEATRTHKSKVNQHLPVLSSPRLHPPDALADMVEIVVYRRQRKLMGNGRPRAHLRSPALSLSSRKQ